MLVRILNAVANHIPELGYVQGMNFIAASLLLIICDEENTFLVMVLFSSHIIDINDAEVQAKGALSE